MKKVIKLHTNHHRHWVGNGFHVRSIFNYHEFAHAISPFLLMDFAAEEYFPPTTSKLGVGEHPHRGFETVTIVYSGEVEHRDSAGGGGKIGPNEVQWMTAASGLVHEEFHGKEYAKKGGLFEMVQLWVNLPAKFKMSPPRYQGIKAEVIPQIDLAGGAGVLRLIAGEFQNHKGAAQTFSPINLWDLRLKANSQLRLKVPENHTTALFVLNGELKNSDGTFIKNAELALMETSGTEIFLDIQKDTKVLLLGGEIIAEPIAGYGPFVMNTRSEIQQAYEDFQNGKMGTLSPIFGSEN